MNTHNKISGLEFSQMSDLKFFLPHCDETKTLCSVSELASTIYILFVLSRMIS